MHRIIKAERFACGDTAFLQWRDGVEFSPRGDRGDAHRLSKWHATGRSCDTAPGEDTNYVPKPSRLARLGRIVSHRTRQKGANRIGAGRLQHISQILQVTVPFFFEGAPAASGARPSAREAAEDDLSPSYLADFLATPDGLSLVKAFMSIEDAKLRRAIVRLVEEIVPETLCFRTNASRPSVRAGGIDEMIGDLN